MERGLLNGRELASLLWLGLIAGWLLLRHRAATLSACAALVQAVRPIAKYLCLYAIWTGGATYLGTWLGLWDGTLLKHTLLWVLLSGVGLFAGTTEAMSRSGWFRRTILATLGATALLEFVVNAKSFPLIVEFVIQPVLFVAVVLPVAAREPEDEQVRAFAGKICTIVGFAALGWTVLAAIDQWADIDKGQLLREAALPVWLTLAAVGFLHPFTVYMAYEKLLKRMRWRANGRSVWRQQLAVLAYAGPRLSVIRDLQGSSDYAVVHAAGIRDALREIRNVRREQRRRREDKQAAAQRLVDNAGIEDRDENGERLDQREFDATRKALQWLATCHMGHYRNLGRYRTDLMPIVESHFERDGLPADHGISMVVAEDGQSWFAYRRTVSNWFFAIGASGPPPDQWCYDGAEPPATFPGEGEWSRFGIGEFAIHW